jgi:hypothetical protein
VYELLELGPNKETRVLHRIYNYTNFSSGTGILGQTTKYVEVYLDLNKIINPDKFSAFFSAENYILSYEGMNLDFCHIVDVGDSRAYIPLPQFVLSASPISYILRPGEEKDIEIKVNSTLQADSEIALFTNQIKNIDSKFIPAKMLLPSNSFTTSTLHIKVKGNATPSTDTIPIFANITFPNTQYYSKEKITNNSNLLSEAVASAEKSVGLGIGGDYNQNNITSNNKTRDLNLKLQYTISAMSRAMSQASEFVKLAQLVELGAFLNNNISKTITETQQLTIIVENYPIQQSFNDVMKGLYALWNDNKEIAILIIGIFLTPFGAWAFDRIVKKEKRKGYKDNTKNK